MSVLFSEPQTRATLSRAAADGRLRSIARGLYTDELDRTDEEAVAAHRWDIVSHLVPDAVIVDRSAAEQGAPQAGKLFIASEARVRDITLPGLKIAVRPGPRLDSDELWASGLRISSLARTLVDNLAVSRGRAGTARTLSRAELGDWVARQARLVGAERLNGIRDEAKGIAVELGVTDRVPAIDALVSAALVTAPAPRGTRALAARASGKGYDEDRVARFDDITALLLAASPSDEIPRLLPAAEAKESSLGFWEAYFSNYIEGTEFDVDQAEQIVQSGNPPADRPADGHDVLGTFRVVTDPVERRRVAHDPPELFDMLKTWHAEILGGRPDAHPGTWKTVANRAGDYLFVQPELVEGTLTEGLLRRERLDNPFARALFMFFLVSEVHPFTDGNGRVARAVMNAELSAAGETRIVVPIVWRNEYLTAIRLLSRDSNVHLYMRTLALAWRWTAAMNWSDPPTIRQLMDTTNALLDSNEAAASGKRLLLPPV